MRKLKLFFACLLMAVLSIGQMWATDFTLSSAAEVTKDGITVTFAKGDGSNAPAWYAAGLRLYVKNTVTITSTANITAISFNWEKQGSKTFNSSCTASTGSYTHPSAAGVGTWTGSATSVTFTLGNISGAQLQLNTFTVTTEDGGGSDPTVSVESVSLNKDATSLEVGENETLTATVSPNDATNKNVTWESSNNNVATVSSTGVVTAVAEGNATITCKSAADNTKTATCAVTVTPAEVPTLTFDFSAQGYENSVKYSPIVADTKITFSFGDGDNDGKYYNTGTAMRVYGGGHMTVAGGEGVTISKILLEFGSGDGSNEISTADNAYANGKWTGSAQSVTFNVGGSSGHRRIKVVKVFYVAAAIDVAMPTISGVTPFLSSTEITLTQNDADAIYYTTNGDDPTTGSTPYSAPFDLTATATVKAIAVKGGVSSAIASATFTKATILTVAEAIAAIPNKDDVVNNQYVEGIVCTAGTSVNASGQMTYYISADGTEATRLQIYLGKNLNNTAFTAVSDLAIGDRVVVFGQLKNYNNTPEMNSGNYLVLKETPAVAAPVFSPNGGGFMGETDVTITCATAGNAIYYTLDGTTPSKSSTLYNGAIHLNATTTITAVAYVDEEHSIVVAKTFTLTAPMTVADALTALDSEDPINNAAVAGIISTAPSSNPSSGKLTYYISDDGTDTDELEVYLGFGLNGASFSAKTDLQVGDEVTVFGNLTIYNSTTKEFATGSRLLAFNRPEVAVSSVSLPATETVEVGSTVTLTATVLPENASDKSITWSVLSGNTYASVADGVVTGLVAGEAVIRAASTADPTKYADCTVTVTEPAPLSPWASVYTSNVTIASNEEKQVTIDGDDYAAAKTNKGTSATITLPQGVTAIHLHLVAWKGEAQTVTVSGDCFNEDKNLTIIANDAVSGTVAKYDLGESGVDYYFSLTPDNAVTANEVITITAASNKRFVLFGVNQEGGLVPELDHIVVSGELTNKDYEVGDELNMDGLTVTAYYTLAGVAHHDEDVTEDVEWSYDPLIGGQTSVDVTATYEGKTHTLPCAITAVVVPEPEIILSQSTWAIGTVDQNADVNAKEITVTLKSVNEVSISLSGNGAGAYTLNKNSLTATGTFTISVNTAEAGSFPATITITDVDGNADSKSLSLSMTVKQSEAQALQAIKWVVATEVYDGMQVLITGVKGETTYAMSTQANNNRLAVAGTMSNNEYVPGDGAKAFTLVKQSGENKYAIMTSNGEYLYAASSSSNLLKTRVDLDNNNDGKAIWTITFNTDGEASIVANCETTNWRNTMQFNTNSPTLFSCYASANQAAIKLYTPKVENLRENLTDGKWGTICPKNDIYFMEGASFYTLTYMEMQGDMPYKLFFDEIETDYLEGGKPYLFIAEGETIMGVRGADDAEAQNYNGFYGNIIGSTIYIETEQTAYMAGNDVINYYGLTNNTFTLLPNGTSVQNERAVVQVKNGALNCPEPVYPAPARPGARRVVAGNNAPAVATGCDEINASEVPVKMLIDGQLFIIRGEKMFDATGRLVK